MPVVALKLRRIEEFISEETLWNTYPLELLEWERLAFRYVRWLQEEGFDAPKTLLRLNAALKKADFDLKKFPICRAI